MFHLQQIQMLKRVKCLSQNIANSASKLTDESRELF